MRDLGNDELLYVKATLPIDLDDPLQYTVVGQLTTFRMSSTAPVTEIRDKDGADNKYGANAYTVDAAVNTDIAAISATGQRILGIAHAANPKTELWWLKTSGVIGERFLRGKMIVGGRTEESNADSAITSSFTMGGVGALAEGLIT